jgi:protein phosphatase
MSEAGRTMFIGPEDGLNCSFQWGGDYVRAVLRSDVGRKRKNNEDSCMVFAPDDAAHVERRGFLFGVADGMGGASAGEHASRLALQCLADGYYDEAFHGGTPQSLRAAIELANMTVFEESEDNPAYAGMGTTMSAVAVMGNWGYLAQVGDSRVYLMRQELGIRQLTDDHSLVAEQMRNGLLNEDEAKNHSLKNLITRAVGIKDAVDVDLFALELHPGDRILLCSDGLSNMVPDGLILSTVTGAADLEGAVEGLVNEALEAGGLDNITVLMLEVTGAPPRTHYQAGGQKLTFGNEGLFRRMRGWFS